jgi:hypothetical protein
VAGHSLGAKNGRKTGRMYFIAANDAAEIRIISPRIYIE